MPSDPVAKPTRIFRNVITNAARTELPATERFSERMLFWIAWISVMNGRLIIAPPRVLAKLRVRNSPKGTICYDEGRT